MIDYWDKQNGFAVAGVLDNENIDFVVSNFSSVLYIATECEESNEDNGFLLKLPSTMTIAEIPINFYDSLWHQKDTHFHKGVSIEKYHQFSGALETLSKPVLISCSDSRRASAVYAAYHGVQSNLHMSKVIELSNSRRLNYLEHAGLFHWVETVVSCLSAKSELLLRQLFDPVTGCCTYLLADKLTKEACLIDPVKECCQRDLDLLSELKLKLQFILETHIHSDHISGSMLLKKSYPTATSVTCENSGVKSDAYVKDEGIVHFGSRHLVCRNTPGHTSSCCSFIMDDFSAAFTGDALHVRGCGRVDIQDGSAESLLYSVHNILFLLPSYCKVYPGHDYEGLRESTVAEERVHNSILGVSVQLTETDAVTTTQQRYEFYRSIESHNMHRRPLVDSASFITANENLRC